MKPFFSIGIPAFKAKFLRECIESILCQTCSDFELIIVNDASPENIDDIVNSFSDDRIRYYKNDKNIGAEHVVDNWNKCLSYATGNYFVLMGDDDRLAHNYLEEFTKLITKYPALDIYHCRVLIIDENSNPVRLVPSWPEYESIYENIWHRMNVFRIQFISDFVYRTSVLKNNNGFYKIELAWASDDISSFIAIGDKGIAHCNIPLLHYRQSSITISSVGSVELKLRAINKIKEWYDSFMENSHPTKETDILLKKNIKENLNNYFRKKVTTTIAYGGLHNKTRLGNYFFAFRMKKKCNLSLKELFYIFVLYEKRCASKF